MQSETLCLGCQSGLARALSWIEPEDRPAPVIMYQRPVRRGHTIRFFSQGDEMAGTLILPESKGRVPALIVCHGAGDWKENYFELCEHLAEKGIATFAIDMHGHGQSGGERFHVDMRQWVADVRAAIDYLSTHPRINAEQIAAFGLSSGGTAILEAALADSRLKAIIALDATVRNSLPLPVTLIMKALLLLGRMKHRLTGKPLRLPLAKLATPHVASDPEINRRIVSYPPSLEALMAFPLPGAEQAFFVDTIKRVPALKVPTLVLWGEDDKVDPAKTGRMLHEALTCKKAIHVIPGNGHVGHLDRNREEVFALTTDWVLQNVAGE